MANTKARGSVEDWLDGLDPATTPASDAADLRRIGAAQDRAEDAEQELTRAVAAARKQGRSWAAIGMVLGISRQAAQQRFGASSRPEPATAGQPVALRTVWSRRWQG